MAENSGAAAAVRKMGGVGPVVVLDSSDHRAWSALLVRRQRSHTARDIS